MQDSTQDPTNDSVPTLSITPELLAEAGVDIPEDQVPSLLEELNEELEERIGEEITNALEDDQLEELVKLQESASDEDVSAWLQTHVPELEQIIQDELDILLGEIAENAEEINKN